MSRQGMEAAVKHAQRLHSFSTLAEATTVLQRERDAAIAAFVLACGQKLGLDYSPESLKRIEGWYFQLGCPQQHLGTPVAHAIAYYLGEVLCRTAGFQWVVSPFPFDTSKYEIGVTRGLYSLMLSGGWAPPMRGNKKRQSLWRQWKQSAL